jgi:hypothetical protein
MYQSTSHERECVYTEEPSHMQSLCTKLQAAGVSTYMDDHRQLSAQSSVQTSEDTDTNVATLIGPSHSHKKKQGHTNAVQTHTK